MWYMCLFAAVFEICKIIFTKKFADKKKVYIFALA